MQSLQFGYHLSSEEHGPAELVRYAVGAEAAGFSFAFISDHFHPWTDRQGHSPFVWGVLGAIAMETERLVLCTGVTCPTMRTHPAIIAHAAATTAALMPGRFILGLGTGERLNEHILGAPWPTAETRREMLVEAIEIIRALWTGELVTHHGRFFTVEQARLYDLPPAPPPIFLAAGGSLMGALAGEVADGIIAAEPSAEVVDAFSHAGTDKPRWGQMKVCWGNNESAARRTAHEWWPIASLPGRLGLELAIPSDFEAATSLVREEQVAEDVICGPDPARYIERVRAFADLGFERVAFHQVGPDQEGFLQFAEVELLPRLRQLNARLPS